MRQKTINLKKDIKCRTLEKSFSRKRFTIFQSRQQLWFIKSIFHKISKSLFITNSTIYPQARNNVISKLFKIKFRESFDNFKKIKSLKPEVGFFIFSSKDFKNILMRIGLIFKTKYLAENDQRWVNRKQQHHPSNW